MRSRMSDISKIFYLEVIDTTFSIDGVLGAFAFTLSIPSFCSATGWGNRRTAAPPSATSRGCSALCLSEERGHVLGLLLGTIMLLEAFHFHIRRGSPRWSPYGGRLVLLQVGPGGPAPDRQRGQ
jgi:hypothetical protein